MRKQTTTNSTNTDFDTEHFPQPMELSDGDLQHHALTFFLTVEQRRRVIAALKHYHQRRTTALMVALGLDENTDSSCLTPAHNRTQKRSNQADGKATNTKDSATERR